MTSKPCCKPFRRGYATPRKAWRGWCWKTRRPAPPSGRTGTPGDVELYLGFVRGLGVSDTQGQLEHIALYRALLEPRLEQARADAAQKSRVLVALGLFGGITLSLLLL